MSWYRLVILVAIVAVVGCDKAQKVTPPSVSFKESAKKALEGIVETGEGGSEIGAIQQELAKLGQTDKALADELINDANDLMSMQLGPEERKAKAKEMIKKLDGLGGGAK
jgi:hypothetical protein